MTMNENKPLVNHMLLDEYFKDPLTYLIRTCSKKRGGE